MFSPVSRDSGLLFPTSHDSLFSLAGEKKKPVAGVAPRYLQRVDNSPLNVVVEKICPGERRRSRAPRFARRLDFPGDARSCEPFEQIAVAVASADVPEGRPSYPERRKRKEPIVVVQRVFFVHETNGRSSSVFKLRAVRVALPTSSEKVASKVSRILSRVFESVPSGAQMVGLAWFPWKRESRELSHLGESN